MKKKSIIAFFGFFVFFGLGAQGALANNIAVSNVSLQNQSAANATVEVKFDVTWDNTYSGTDANLASFYDRAWVFVKYWVVGTDSEDTGWHHATLTSGGTLTPTSDGKGAIANIGTDQTLKWYYGTDGVAGNATVRVRLCAIEAVYIPTGQFIYNGTGRSYGQYGNNFGGTSEVTVDEATDVPTGASTGWPNGYSAFYIAKYEVSQGQYSDYLNMLSDSTAWSLFANTTSYGHTITYTSDNDYGSRYAASSENRANNYMSWTDTESYIGWCAMRPMTEMEFEKAARGGGTTGYQYPWGDTTASTEGYTVDGATHTKYYGNADPTSGYGAKPINVGHYLSGDVSRTDEQTGASPYGVTDMGGSLLEKVVTCAHTTTPTNGDGTTTPPASWPGVAGYYGGRGGACYDGYGMYNMSISRRFFAVSEVYASFTTGRGFFNGTRPARTAE